MSAAGWRGAGAALGLTLLALSGCSTVPYTNRSQFMMMAESDDLRLGAAAYQQVLKKEKIVRDPRITAPVQEVGRRIAAAADKPEYQWEFTVIDDPKQANAFCLPGGKVAVYTGIFPIAKDEAGLATVIGHEVAHALARHGAERMSTGMALQAAGAAVAIASGGQSAATQQAIMTAYGLGAQVGVALPFSRSQESEADRIGLILMAKAGYDPEAALGLWQRMEQNSGGKGPPEWLSTHPAEGTRQDDIRGWIAEARQYYRPPPAPDAMLPAIAGTGGGSSGRGSATDEPRFR
ncbi:M48 family metallopeptidase [bacterium]|nr:M48 family metallopeptidase [bacterium]